MEKLRRPVVVQGLQVAQVRAGGADTGVSDRTAGAVGPRSEEALMSAITSARAEPVTGTARLPHPVLRATAWSSMIGLVAGLVLGVVTQVQEHDGR